MHLFNREYSIQCSARLWTMCSRVYSLAVLSQLYLLSTCDSAPVFTVWPYEPAVFTLFSCECFCTCLVDLTNFRKTGRPTFEHDCIYSGTHYIEYVSFYFILSNNDFSANQQHAINNYKKTLGSRKYRQTSEQAKNRRIKYIGRCSKN